MSINGNNGHHAEPEHEELHLQGQAEGSIWAMLDRPGLIRLRLDCEDAGTVYMTKEQAKEVINVLQHYTT